MTVASMANAGAGFGHDGSMGNYHEMPGMVNFIATILMLLGRFEIFGFIQLFFLNKWK